mmetsp:Transcript_36040/g.80221  ORF Transcript_36040/g.80221 Transcript_36040/m.80221 type:complete len:243 (+) Transcript_36040:110-838(+)|eukprot:CAMPEP_0202903396 /NCGR_PEP_ID=MMETSP1392-20130828/24216_1 /ASSEMBLY_ACC=CAM_ASM_000868 /TAXON_ID=225041 /ORGANISM="Chlamydomonas chlamydogama, Strain SAG 11-48b" /LENGTH=242 /DNA_ID=CAMNT_0049590551 /DNA_START=65 /DNA_END=793 /DNA_ORIENTATION=+
MQTQLAGQRVGLPRRLAASNRASRSVVSCVASSSKQQPQQQPQAEQRQQQQGKPLLSALLGAGVAAGLTLSMLSGAVPEPAQAAKFNTLADILRSDLSFIDANSDGVITEDELIKMSNTVAELDELTPPPIEALDFTLKLFDLNMDGTLTTDEMLTAMVLDAAVSEDAVDADVVSVFDKNNDGFVTQAEWDAPFGDLDGQQGETVKNYVFKKVDGLVHHDGKLDTTELGEALTLVRTLVLGY